jgi:uncharacterized Zn-binding protein involved in type VI secretion
MGATLNANNMTVVHAGSGGMSTAAPDTCKTPTPGGPVPLPYPNIAQSSDASQVSTTVKVDGNGVMIDGSKFALSSGDEAGSALGIMSSKIKGTAEFKNFSTDVKFDGKAVARLSDPMGQNQGSDNAAGPAEVQGPLVVVDSSGQTDEQKEACAKVEKCKVKEGEHDQAAKEAGMLKGDYDSFRKTCQQENVSVTFRDTNPACLPHLERGVPSKGHDVLTKTFPADNLFERDQDYAGLVSTLKNKPAPPSQGGRMLTNPENLLHEPELTGDYDMMDILGSDGKRISGQGEGIQEALNSGLPSGGEPPRIMHGPQSAYKDYLENEASEAEKKNPIKFKKIESPLTAFDKDGSVYRLKTQEDVENYYKCKGCGNPKY